MPLPLWQVALLPLLALGGCAGTAARPDDTHRAVSEWVGGADTVHVRLQGLEMRDCMYVLAGEADVTRGYRLAAVDGLDLFVALHSDSRAVLRLERELALVPGSGETDSVTVVSSAMVGGVRFEEWLQTMTVEGITVDSLYGVYDRQYLEALGRR